jgi:hypothetical protein
MKPRTLPRPRPALRPLAPRDLAQVTGGTTRVSLGEIVITKTQDKSTP